MGRMIDSDIYKLRKSKYFWVCMLLAVGMAVANVVIARALGTGEIKPTAINHLIEFFASDFNLILIGIVVALFVGGEYSSGTIKNIASTNISREKIYASKTLVSIAAAVAITVASAIGGFIATLVYFGLGKITAAIIGNTLLAILLELLLLSAFTAIYVMFSFLIRQSGGAVAVNICFLQFFNMIVQLIMLGLDYFFGIKVNLIQYLVEFNMSAVAGGISNNVTIRALLVAAGFFLVSYLIGYASFKKRDIK